MDSKATAAIALIVSLNLLFFSMTEATTKLNGCGDRDLSVCLNVLSGGLIPSKNGACCTLIKGLVDLELDVCLCAVVKANILGLLLVDATAQLNLLLNYCGCPYNYHC